MGKTMTSRTIDRAEEIVFDDGTSPLPTTGPVKDLGEGSMLCDMHFHITSVGVGNGLITVVLGEDPGMLTSFEYAIFPVNTLAMGLGSHVRPIYNLHNQSSFRYMQLKASAADLVAAISLVKRQP